MSDKVGKFYHYSGAVHMHTTASDGTKEFDEVVKIGLDAGLDFMMFSDHMTLIHRDNGGEGLYDKMPVIVGYEHNDEADHHHYLLFDSPKVYDPKMTAAEYVKAGADDNAIGIMAHPDEIRNRLPDYPPYPWDDWSVEGFTGLELWNQMSEWMEKLTRFNKLAMSLSPRKSMVGPTDRILKKWDDLNQKQKFVGIAGVDAHEFTVKVGPFNIKIFPYKVHFKCLRTHLILREPFSDDFETAKRQIFDALRECRIFNSNMRWGEANKFEFFIEQHGNRFIAGDTVADPDKAVINIKLPKKATLKLIHNSDTILTTESDSLEYSDIKKGLYRCEAWIKDRGWIFSNHIRVGI